MKIFRSINKTEYDMQSCRVITYKDKSNATAVFKIINGNEIAWHGTSIDRNNASHLLRKLKQLEK